MKFFNARRKILLTDLPNIYIKFLDLDVIDTNLNEFKITKDLSGTTYPHASRIYAFKFIDSDGRDLLP